MNQSNDNHEPTTVDQLHDRLLDTALAEVVGGQSPPDLSERILSVPSRATASPVGRVQPRRRFRWIELAVAASLAIGLTWLLFPAADSARESSRDLAQVAGSQAQELPVLREGRGQTPGEKLAVDRYANQTSGRSESQSGKKSVSLPTALSPEKTWELGDVRSRAADPKNQRRGEGDSPAVDFDALIDLIKSRVSSEAWGHGKEAEEEVVPFDTNLSLVISQSQSVHEELAAGEAPQQPRGGRSARQGLRHYYLDDDVQREPASSRERELHMMVKPQMLAFRGEPRLERFFHGDVDGQDFPAFAADGVETDLGTGPGLSGDQYTRIYENPFIKAVGGDAVSTFSIDVDTASYANVRQFLTDMRQLPPPDAVRIEELVNYFPYDYAGPSAEPGAEGRGGDAEAVPFAAHVEVAGCPWTPEHRLVRIGVKGREIERDQRPDSNLVFLVDVSGSMDEPSKLPLVVEGLQQLAVQLSERDRVAIVVYASSKGLALASTPGSDQRTILAALGRLRAGGSTAGGAGIQLAYQLAEDHFIEGGTNRVILCTDGDFNVGVTSTAELERLVEKKAKETGVFLSVLGFGRGNLNDAMMETISNRGNGNYYYVDNRTEARKVLVDELGGTLVTIAKDVKIQVEFNPRRVAGYRLIGYENRMLRTEDFNDDTKDAGEIGAGHAVTALYEVIPAGQLVDVPAVDNLKYQQPQDAAVDRAKDLTSGELLTLKMRYKQPDGDTSRKLEWPVTDDGQAFSAASTDFQFAASVAGFGLLLRDSQHRGNANWDAVLEIAHSSRGSDPHGYRAEFVELVRSAKKISSRSND